MSAPKMEEGPALCFPRASQGVGVERSRRFFFFPSLFVSRWSALYSQLGNERELFVCRRALKGGAGGMGPGLSPKHPVGFCWLPPARKVPGRTGCVSCVKDGCLQGRSLPVGAGSSSGGAVSPHCPLRALQRPAGHLSFV